MFDMVRGLDRGPALDSWGVRSVIFPSGRYFFGVRSVRTVVIKIVIGVFIWNVRWWSLRCR